MSAAFTVHIPSAPAGQPSAPERIVFLRDGFSLPAFVFGPFWLAWRRAFLPALGWAAAILLVGAIGAKLGAPRGALSVIGLAMSVALGFEGSRLVAWSLARRGFKESAVIIAADAGEAEEMFLRNWRPAAVPPPPPPPPPPATMAGERPA